MIRGLIKFCAILRIALGGHHMTDTHFATASTAGAVILTADRTTAIVVAKTVHILKRSSSRYGLRFSNGRRLPYCCQDGCCDRGLQPEVAALVRQAKELGARTVILRTGQRQVLLSGDRGPPGRRCERPQRPFIRRLCRRQRVLTRGLISRLLSVRTSVIVHSFQSAKWFAG